MNRELDKQERMEDPDDRSGEARPARPPATGPRPRRRTSLRTFLREVRGELKRVAWPSRREITSYSVIVLVTVVLVTTYVFALDQAFGQLVLEVFG